MHVASIWFKKKKKKKNYHQQEKLLEVRFDQFQVLVP